MSGLAVFAYASLVGAASAAETLGRRPDAFPARLEGWRRRWTVRRDNLSAEKTFARPDGSLPRFCLGLSLEPAPGEPGANGVLIAVSAAELERLDLREMRYERFEVGDAVRPAERSPRVAFERVYAYRGRPESRSPEPPGDAIVIASYLRAIEAAFAELGPSELDAYRASTDPPPVEVSEAVLVRDRIPAGNPRRW